jgi:DNA-binding beta-propeller fold protein YncE
VVCLGHAIRIRVLIALAGAFLTAGAVVGCGGATGNVDEREGERGALEQGADATTDEKTTTPEEDRSASGAAREQVGLDAEVVSPGGAYMPAGFGEGSLWATDVFVCNDTMSVSGSASASSAASVQAACAAPNKMLLKRLDPQTGEKVAAIPLEGFFANIPEVAVGAGSVWVSSADGFADAVLKVDPETERVVERIPVDTSSGLDFGYGSVWVTSAEHGTPSRIDPESGKVVAKIDVGKGAVDITTDEGSGAVWVADWMEDGKLSRVDPQTNRVVAEIPIRPGAQEGGASSVAVGEGAVWAQSVDGKLLKVDPTTNEVVAKVSLGDYSSYLAIYGDAVWATVQGFASQRRLLKVDPRTVEVVAYEDVGPVPKTESGRLVAGGGRIWFVSAAGKTGKGELAWVAP